MKKPLIYQAGTTVRINTAGPRPLLQALDALQGKYGWTVDYEEPAIASTPPGGPPPDRRRHPMTAPANDESFGVQFQSGPPPSYAPDEAATLKLIVDAYDQSGSTAQFEVRKNDDGNFAVIGAAVNPQQEEPAKQEPILDFPILLPRARRTAQETIILICRKLSEAGKIQIATTGLEDDPHAKRLVLVGGSRLPARVFLSRTVLALGGKRGWRMLYYAAEKKYSLQLTPLSP